MAAPPHAARAPGTEHPHRDNRTAKRLRSSTRSAAAVMDDAIALLLLFAIAAGAVLLLHVVLAAHAFSHRRRRSRYRVPSLAASPPHPRAGLSPAELRLLPCFAFASPRDDNDASLAPRLCAVCIEVGRAGERWRALPACGHAFHAACVDRWIAKSAACPVCRATVAVPVS